jgi:6-phosphogluconolactonase (cycloisomerase 2 family)
MAKKGRLIQQMSSFFRSGLPPCWETVKLLLLLSIFLGASPEVSSQTSPQQRLYVSQSATTSSSVSGFNKAGQTGALGLIAGSPFNERLEGGLMAIDGQGKFLFVINPTSNDISMFQIDETSGALTEVAGSPFAVPPIFTNWLPPSQPLSIATEPSGKFVFVGYFYAGDQSQSGGNSPGRSTVVSLAIDTSGSSPILSAVSLPSAAVFPSGAPIKLLSDSKGLHLYVGMSVAQNGASASGPEVYSIDGTGNLSFQGTAPNPENDGFDFAIDPQDRFVFAVGGLQPEYLFSFPISPVDGTISSVGGQVFLSPKYSGGW